MNDQIDVKVAKIDMDNADTLKKLQEREQEACAKWKEHTTTKFAMKLLSHGDPEKAEIVKGLVDQTFEAAFTMGIATLLHHGASVAQSIKPNGMGIPCPGVGEA